MSKNCLIIFTRNPELGKGKRRLAATLGDEKTLKVYNFLLDHTRSITENVNADCDLWYSERVHEQDAWDNDRYGKYAQVGEDLGERMYYAFETAYASGYENVIIIGSDLYDLSTEDLNTAFAALENKNAVIGPATDGGYYLLGFHNDVVAGVFENKDWGTPTVLKNTLADLKNVNYAQLEPRNDVDYYEDIKDVPVFIELLKD